MLPVKVETTPEGRTTVWIGPYEFVRATRAASSLFRAKKPVGRMDFVPPPPKQPVAGGDLLDLLRRKHSKSTINRSLRITAALNTFLPTVGHMGESVRPAFNPALNPALDSMRDNSLGESSRTAAASSSLQAKESPDPTDESVRPAFNPALDIMCGNSFGESSNTAAQKRKVLELDSPHGEPSSEPSPIVKRRRKLKPSLLGITKNEFKAKTDERCNKMIGNKPNPNDSLNYYASIISGKIPPPEVQLKEQVPKRKIVTKPLPTLSAPGFVKDDYSRVLDWSSTDVLAFALGDVVHLYNASKGRRSSLDYTFDCNIGAVAFDPNGSFLAVGTRNNSSIENSKDNMIHFFDINSKKLLKTLEVPAEDGQITALAWHPVRKMITVGTRYGYIYHFSNVFSEKHDVLKVEAHYLAVISLKWRSDGSLLASGSLEGHVRVWRSEKLTRGIHRYIQEPRAKALAWCPRNADLLASASEDDEKIHVWDTKTGTLVKAVNAGSGVISLHWSKDCRELVSIHGFPKSRICTWDYTTTERKVNIPVHAGYISHLATNPSMEKLATLTTDNKLRFWEIFTAHGSNPLPDET